MGATKTVIKFRNNKILLDGEGLGERFRRARAGAGIGTEKAASDLNINAYYLRALEKGLLRKLPAGLYRKNIICAYAHYLKMDAEEVLDLFGREDAADYNERCRNVFSRKAPHVSYFLPTPKILRSALLAAIVLVCVGYLGLCFQRIVSPPKLTIFTPAGEIVEGRFNVDVAGATEPEAEVVINGEPVLTDAGGNFVKTVNLKTGMNTILVSAQKKYSPKNSITKRILVRGGG